MRVYIDGQDAKLNSKNFASSLFGSWDHGMGLQLFANNVESTFDSLSSPFYTGAIHGISFFDSNLSSDDVATLFKQGHEEERSDSAPLSPTEPAKESHNALSLTATSTKNLNLIEGHSHDVQFEIGGTASGVETGTNVWVEILTEPQHGKLIHAGKALKKGALLHTSNGKAKVGYEGEQNYFNIPKTTSNGEDLGLRPDSFTFRLIQVAKGNPIIATSNVVEQAISVHNFNNAPAIDISNVQILAHAGTDQTEFMVIGVLISDPDRNVDKVRVDISVDHGFVQLNKDYLRLADFKKCSSRKDPEWKCSGSGSGHRQTFVVEPDDLEKLLEDMIYFPQSVDGRSDQIHINIFDGVGGNCLTEHEHLSYGSNLPSIRKGCLSVGATIPINMKGGHAGSLRKVFGRSVTDFLVGAMILVVIVLLGRHWRLVRTRREEDIISNKHEGLFKDSNDAISVREMKIEGEKRYITVAKAKPAFTINGAKDDYDVITNHAFTTIL